MRETILDILAEVCGDASIRENEEIDLFETGLLDSLAFISLLNELEDCLAIEIQPSQVERECWRTPKSIISLIETMR